MFDGLKLYLQRWSAASVRHKPSTPRKTLANADAHEGAKFDHSTWDAVLRSHVTTGATLDGIVTATVNYAGVAADGRFTEYLQALAAADVPSLAPAEQFALWINAYNALCIHLVVEHDERQRQQQRGGHAHPPPLASITALSTRHQAVWDRPAGCVGGQAISLGEIEHRELRGLWDEPLLHCCIVCASASCPDLRAGAYTGAGLAAQMEEQARAFVRNRTKGVAWDGTQLRLSRILYWFADDFGGPAAARAWAIDRLGSDDEGGAPCVAPGGESGTPRSGQAAGSSSGMTTARASYFEYSWALNRTPGTG